MRRLKSSGLISGPKGAEERIKSAKFDEKSKKKHRTKTKHVAHECEELGFVELNDTKVLREAVGTNTGGDGRCPNDVANDAIAQLTPFPEQRDVELLEVHDPPVDLNELGLVLIEPVLRRREIDLLLHAFGQSPDERLESLGCLVESADMGLDRVDVAVEGRLAHYDDAALRSRSCKARESVRLVFQ